MGAATPAGDGDGGLAWVEAGRRFDLDDITWFSGKGERPLEEVLPAVDTIVTGPHASAALPEELRPYVAPGLTRRLQFDFSDMSTSAVGRRWAEIDPHVLFVENPHPRAVRDPNRPRPADLEADLREAFRRLESGEHRPSIVGVDAVRPVTFGYLPLLRRPGDDLGWRLLAVALTEAAALGVDVYERARDDLVQRVVEAKCRALTSLDPATTPAAEVRSARMLFVLALHDTMNFTALPDGAIAGERAPADRLPDLVALSNRGDEAGEVRASASGELLGAGEMTTVRPRWLRAVATAYRRAFGAWSPGDVALNRPYLGGNEIQAAGRVLAELEPRTVVRHADGSRIGLVLGAFQDEFLRERLVGPEVTATLMQPGGSWPEVPAGHVADLAEKLRRAHDELRRWGTRLGQPGGTPA